MILYLELIPLIAQELILLGLLLLPLDLHLLIEILNILNNGLLVLCQLEVVLGQRRVIDRRKQMEQRRGVEAGVLHVQLVDLFGGDDLLAVLDGHGVHLVDEFLLALDRQALDDRLDLVAVRVGVVSRQHQAGSPPH